jgi:hypothetical protein
MNRTLAVLFLVAGFLLAPLANATPKAKPKHALVKVAVVVVKAPKAAFKITKATLGSALFAVETVNDVVLGGLTGLDKAAGMELKYNPFHYLAVVDGKIDQGIEKGETFFFGSSN